MKGDIILGVLAGQYDKARRAFLDDPEACDWVLRWAREKHADGRYRVESVRLDDDQFVLTMTDMALLRMRETAIELNDSGELAIPMPTMPEGMEKRETVIDFFGIFQHLVLKLTDRLT